jgi:hypothetical protein
MTSVGPVKIFWVVYLARIDLMTVIAAISELCTIGAFSV